MGPDNPRQLCGKTCCLRIVNLIKDELKPKTKIGRINNFSKKKPNGDSSKIRKSNKKNELFKISRIGRPFLRTNNNKN